MDQTLKQRVDFLRNVIGTGKPFVVDPDIRRECLVYGLDRLGIKLVHEKYGDGVHDTMGGVYFCFKEPEHAKERELGQQGELQSEQGSAAPSDSHAGGAEDPGQQDGGGQP